MTLANLLLILFSVSITAVAQLILKRGMSGPQVQSAMETGGSAQILLASAGSPLIWSGMALYGGGAMVWLLVLARIDVSQAYPFVGLGFIITLIFSALLLGEVVTPLRVLGTLIIILGITLIAQK